MNKPAKKLLTHRTVAAMLDISTQTLRSWVANGLFPVPHSDVSTTWFYRASDIEHYVRTGGWPEGVHFLGAVRVDDLLIQDPS